MEQHQVWSTFYGDPILISFDEVGVCSIEHDGWRIYVHNGGGSIGMRLYDRLPVATCSKILALAKWCEEGLQWNA